MNDDRSSSQPRRSTLGATWESEKPAANVRNCCDLDAGEVVAVERAAGGLVETCDLHGRPLAPVEAGAPVDVLDADLARVRANFLEVSFAQLLKEASSTANTLRDVARLERGQNRTPVRGGPERGLLLSACEKFLKAAAAGKISDGRPPTATPLRRLVYRFLSVSYVSRVRLAERLRLAADGDEALPERERWRLVLKRAEEAGQLAELWDAVSEALGTPADNPFKAAGDVEV